MKIVDYIHWILAKTTNLEENIPDVKIRSENDITTY